MAESGLPPEIIYLSICPPFAVYHGLADPISDQLVRWLPTRDTAWQLVQIYFGRMAAL